MVRAVVVNFPLWSWEKITEFVFDIFYISFPGGILYVFWPVS